MNPSLLKSVKKSICLLLSFSFIIGNLSAQTPEEIAAKEKTEQGQRGKS